MELSQEHMGGHPSKAAVELCVHRVHQSSLCVVCKGLNVWSGRLQSSRDRTTPWIACCVGNFMEMAIKKKTTLNVCWLP